MPQGSKEVVHVPGVRPRLESAEVLLAESMFYLSVHLTNFLGGVIKAMQCLAGRPFPDQEPGLELCRALNSATRADPQIKNESLKLFSGSISLFLELERESLELILRSIPLFHELKGEVYLFVY